MTKTDRMIIGLGGAGKNVLAEMGPQQGSPRLLVNTDKASLATADAEWKIYVDREVIQRGGDFLPSSLLSHLAGLSRGQGKVAIVCGPRSKQTSQLLVTISRLLLDMGCSVDAILFAPFAFEPRTYFDAAIDALETMAPWLVPYPIDLERCGRLAPAGASLTDVLSQANAYAIAMALGTPHADGPLGTLMERYGCKSAADLAMIRLICRVNEVWLSAQDVNRGAEPLEALQSGSETRELGGTLECARLFTLDDEDPVVFHLTSPGDANWGGLGQTPEEVHGTLKRSAELREAVVVTCRTMSIVHDQIQLYDPLIELTGIPFDHLELLISE